MLKNTSLGVKLNILMLLAISLLLAGIVGLLIRNTQTLTKEVGGEQIIEQVTIIQNRLEEIEHELLVDTNFVKSNVNFFQAVGSRDAANTSQLIMNANASLGLDEIAVVDGDGAWLADTRGDENQAQENELLRIALQGNTLTRLLIEENAGQIEVSLAAASPVVSNSGNILGAIQMSRHISDDFLQSLTFGQHGIYLGLIYENYIVARSGGTSNSTAHSLTSNILFDEESVQLAQVGQPVVLEDLISGEGGVPHTVAYVPVLSDDRFSSAVIMILVELRDLFVFQNNTLRNTIIVFAALTIFALATMYFNIYRTMILPLNRLKIIAKTMTSGQYDERAPADTTDEIGQLAAVFNDMAIAIQQREVSLHAAREQAERADQVKSMFLASVSHELRTPLNAIINLTKFVALGMYGPVNEEQVDILQKVVSGSNHLLNLINDVLDISKIETGSLELFVEEDIDVGAIVESTVETAKGLLIGKQVEIISHINHPLPTITGDERRIQQIVLNLLSNACKFTEEGEIIITVGQQAYEIIIAIKDSGPGIEPDSYELIFEAFRQTRDGLRKGHGTGLGLPISRRLAEAHGGRVWLESTLGEGSTFYAALPLDTSLAPTL